MTLSVPKEIQISLLPVTMSQWFSLVMTDRCGPSLVIVLLAMTL